MSFLFSATRGGGPFGKNFSGISMRIVKRFAREEIMT